MTRTINRLLILGMIAILAAGIALTFWMAHSEDNRLREDLLIQARLAVAGINAAQVATLTGSDADLTSPDYQALKGQMAEFRAVNPDTRFTYIIGRRVDDTYFFFVDSEPPESEDYSPPGQEYPEVTALIKKVYSTGIPMTAGPDSDRWGTWVSSVVPVRDPETGNIIAVFGMDIDAQNWNTRVFTASLPAVTATFVLLFLLLVFSYVQERNEHDRQILEQSQKTLRESEHRLNDIINFLPDATLVIDREGRVITWNKAIEEMTGVMAGEMLGKGNYEYALPFYKERRPILINLVLEPDNEIAKKYTGGVHREGDQLFTETDTDLERPDGTHAFLAARASPLRDVQGNLIGAIESIRDVTRRKQAELRLKTSEERLRLLFENVNDGILVHRISKEGPGQILEANDRVCKILRYTREELLQMSIKDIVVPEQQDNYRYNIR